MGELKDLTVEEFTARTASSAPVPGGGSVAALAGALAAALSEMVANLTIGKAKYAGVEEEMRKLAEKGSELRGELLEGNEALAYEIVEMVENRDLGVDLCR